MTVTEAFSSGVNSCILATNGNLRLLGSIEHRGTVEAIVMLGRLLGKLSVEGAVGSNEKSEILDALAAPGLGSITLTKDEVINVSHFSFGEIAIMEIHSGVKIVLPKWSGQLNVNGSPELFVVSSMLNR